MSRMAEPHVAAACEVAESPRWDARTGRLVWVDVHRGLLLTTGDAGVEIVARSTGRITAVSARRAGGYVVAVDEGFAVVNGGVVESVSNVTLDPDMRMNDGSCDPLGRFWAGSMRLDCQGAVGGLWCLHPDGSVTEHARRLGISNGIDWSPDGTRMYHVDSGPGLIRVYDYDVDAAQFGSGRVLADRWKAPETPDGLAVDADGYLWVAIWRGGRVERLTPAGDLDFCIDVAAPLTTSCTFGDDDAGVLYVTTARNHLEQDELSRWPESGGLFRYSEPGGLPGRHAYSFAG